MDDKCEICFSEDISKKCKDDEGKSRKQGEFWRPTTSNCEECTCDSGITKCRPIECTVEPTCNDPRAVAGICCPICPSKSAITEVNLFATCVSSIEMHFSCELRALLRGSIYSLWPYKHITAVRSWRRRLND